MKTAVYSIKIKNYEKKIFWGLVASMVFIFIIYGYLVNTTIVNIVERKNLEFKVEELVTTVSGLEVKYGALKNKITHSYANSIGYIEPKKQIFVSRKQLVKNITISN